MFGSTANKFGSMAKNSLARAPTLRIRLNTVSGLFEDLNSGMDLRQAGPARKFRYTALASCGACGSSVQPMPTPHDQPGGYEAGAGPANLLPRVGMLAASMARASVLALRRALVQRQRETLAQTIVIYRSPPSSI